MLGRLPDRVILCIYQHTCGSPGDISAAWASQLPLLAVCRQWRKVLEPVAWNTLYIKHCEQPYTASLDLNTSQGYDPPVELFTNLNVLQDHTARFVESVVVSIHVAYNPVFALRKAVASLEKQAPKGTFKTRWGDVRRLDLRISFGQYSALASDRSFRRYETWLKPLVKPLKTMFPHLTELNMSCGGCVVVKEMEDELMNHYRGSIKTLQWSGPVRNANDFNELTRLDLAVCENLSGFKLCVASAKSLEVLRMRDIPRSLNQTIQRKGKSYLKLPHLHTLVLEYNPATPTCTTGIVAQPQVRVPQLNELVVRGNPDYCPILASLVVPDEIRRVQVAGQPAIMKLLAGYKLRRVDELVLEPYAQVSEDTAICTVLRLFKVASRVGSLVLHGHQTLDPKPPGLEFLNLTHLSITAPTTTSTVLGLIKLPKLQFLSLYMVADSGIDGRSLVLGVTPFKVPLHTISLNYAFGGDGGPALVTYLALCLPDLRLVDAKQVPREPVMRNLDGLEAKYPNLGNIQFWLAEETPIEQMPMPFGR